MLIRCSEPPKTLRRQQSTNNYTIPSIKHTETIVTSRDVWHKQRVFGGETLIKGRVEIRTMLIYNVLKTRQCLEKSTRSTFEIWKLHMDTIKRNWQKSENMLLTMISNMRIRCRTKTLVINISKISKPNMDTIKRNWQKSKNMLLTMISNMRIR